MTRTQLADQQTSQAESQRQLRSDIGELYEDARRVRDLLARPGAPELEDRLAKLDALSQQVAKPRERAEESEVFNFMATQGAQMAKTLGQSGQVRTAGDFVRALLQAFGSTEDGAELDPDSFRWEQLSQRLIGTKRAAPGASCVLGTLAVEAKKRKVTQRQPKQKLAAVQAPEQMQQEQEAESETKDSDKILAQLAEVLAERPRVLLLPLILSHTSFAQTVENLFALAFLVRDAKVALSDSPEGAVVELSSGKESARAAEGAVRQQFVLSYTMADWEAWKQAVPPADCLLASIADGSRSEASQQENQVPGRKSKARK